MPLDQVLVIKATNLTTGYSFVGIDSDRGSVWDASKSAYGTTISAASFALGGDEICSTKRYYYRLALVLRLFEILFQGSSTLTHETY